MNRILSTRTISKALEAPLGLRVIVFCLTVLLMASGAAHAQLSGRGAITGTVLDASGAAVPGAAIVITNVANGVATTTTSTSAGDYSVATLDPGMYTVTITAPGFQKLTQKNIQVNALETATFSPKLTVGAADQSITVSTAPPQLETTNATLGATMEAEMYSALPIQMGAGGNPDQRRATDFAALMPGVQTNTTGNANNTTSTGIVNGSGSKGGASAVYIDGVPFTNVVGEGDPRFVWTAISVDSVDQFQVETTGSSALYEGQGVQNYVIKQGGNKYHGSVYEFFRNTALDTWGFFAPAQINPAVGHAVKPVEHQNEYGIVLSGPLIPFGKWKDKVFFFGNYDGFRYSQVNPQYNTFPNLAEQSGDFSGVAAANGVNIYDPNSQAACTAHSTTGQCRYQFGYVAGAGAGPAGNPVLGPNGSAGVNVIPQSELSAVALAMQSNIPTLTNQNLTNNYIAPNASGLTNFSTTNRIDYIVSHKDTLTFLGAIGRQASSTPVGQNTAGRGVANLPYNYAQAYAPKTVVAIVEETHTFTDHLVNQFKYGFARYNGPTINADFLPAYAAANYGISGLPAGQAAGAFPITSFGTSTDAPTQWAGTTAGLTLSNSYALVDNVQWIKGKHSITIGGDVAWLQLQYNTATGGSTPLNLTAATTETAGFQNNSNALVSNTGLSYASFLLGQIDSATLTQNSVQETGARFRPISPYAEDTWKVTSKLTLDLGVRYDFFPTYREAHDVMSFFNPTLTNPITGTPGALQFAGTGANTCNCHTPVDNYYKNVGPRIGLAYQSDPKTVWRASYGVMFTHGNGVGGSAISRNGTGTLGFSASPKFSADTGTDLSTAPLNAFPAYASALGRASGNGYGTGYTTTPGFTGTPSSVAFGDPYLGGRAPEFINWSFGFQHQWTPNFSSSISYVGSQGHFLSPDGSNARGYFSDALDPKYLSLGACLSSTIVNLSKTTAPNGQSCATVDPVATPAWYNTSQTLSQLLKPFPQYGVSDAYGNVGNANYHALQITMMKRPSRGFTIMANYTWSRSIDDNGTYRTGYAIPAAFSNNGKAWAQDRIERTVSTSNQPQHVVVTGVWDLPFGKGALGGAHAWSRALLGGYKFSEIFQMYSGSPLVLTGSSCQTNPAQSTCEPNLNPNFSGSARINGRWGKGVIATLANNPSFIAPSGGTATAPTGPFIAPSLLAATKALPNGSPFAPLYTFSNAPRTAPYDLYGPGNYDVDISLRRSFNLHLTESSRLSLQADMYNVTNHTQFGGIGTVLGSTSFGTVSSQANKSRDVQLSGRFEF